MAIFISEFKLWDVEFVTLLSNRNSHQDKQFKYMYIVYSCWPVLCLFLFFNSDSCPHSNSKERNPCWFLI